MATYRIKIVKNGLELEVEGDKKFVLDMLARYDKGTEAAKSGTGSKKTIDSKEQIAGKSLSPGEFIRTTGFKKAVDIVLAFGYYLEKSNGLASFAPTDINACYYEAKMESSNTSQFIILLIRKSFLMEAKQIEKKGRKKYTLTKTGIDYIEGKLRSNSGDKD